MAHLKNRAPYFFRGYAHRNDLRRGAAMKNLNCLEGRHVECSGAPLPDLGGECDCACHVACPRCGVGPNESCSTAPREGAAVQADFHAERCIAALLTRL
jgi:hypothetical protein